MAAEHFSERTRLAAYAAEAGRRSVVERLLTSRLYRWRFAGAAADRFLIVPQDLRTADPSFATEVYHGHFGLSGTLVVVGNGSPFAGQMPNVAWERELHGFSWIRHLGASYDDVARQHAQFLLIDWIDRLSDMQGVAWETGVTARRVVSWLSHAPALFDDAGEEDYDKLLRSLGSQLRFLSASYGNTIDGAPRLTALMALVFGGLCLADREDLVDRFSDTLCRELDRQILPDGGHISRNPWANIDILLDLLPLKQCFVTRDIEPPELLIKAIGRMLPMVRFMRMGDGYLGRFNGMAATLPDAIATVLAYDDTEINSSGQAPQSGYSRLSHDDTIVLVDSGKPPELALSSQAHAGCLSFEMSVGTSPMIVNSGAPGPAHKEWALNARTTSSHSTLSIENASSSRLLKSGLGSGDERKSFLSGPGVVTGEIRSNARGTHFIGSHDGYLDRYGVIHVRKLHLDASGGSLEGEDHVYLHGGVDAENAKLGTKRFELRFHLHPDVNVTWPDRQGPVLLEVGPGQIWSFNAKDGKTILEESMFLSDYRGPRRAVQLVVRGSFEKEARVRWVFEKKQKSDTRPKSIESRKATDDASNAKGHDSPRGKDASS